MYPEIARLESGVGGGSKGIDGHGLEGRGFMREVGGGIVDISFIPEKS
jgi:hypothetical protein